MNRLSRRMKGLLAIVLVEAIVAANVITSYANEAYEPFTMTEQEAAQEAGDASYEEESHVEEVYEESYEEETHEKDSYVEESYEEAAVPEVPAVAPEDSISSEEETPEETLTEELLCICTEECTIEEIGEDKYNKECPVCKEIEELDTDEEKEEFLLKKCLIVKENASKVPAQMPTEITKPEEEATASPEATETPEATTTPDSDKLETASPKASETPEATMTPAASVTPEATETPDVSASPDVDEEAVVSASPDASTSPDASASPSPEASATPSDAQGLSGVVIEKKEGLVGSVEQRASRMIFSKQVNMDYTVTVKNTSEEAVSNVEVTAEIPSIITVGSVSGGSVSNGTVAWTVDEIGAGKTVRLTAKGFVNENTDNVDNLNGRFYINGEKIEDVGFDGEWRLLEADDTEGPTYISTVVDGVTISVSAADGSILPNGVSVKATKVSASDAIATLAAELGLDILDAVAFDVVLIVNGEEVQPDGSVVVSFHDVPLEYVEGGDVGVAHMADNDTVEDFSEGGSLQDVSIETTHFSVYVVYSTRISGTYSPSNGVTTSDGKSMACFDFHIFANYYDSEYQGHVNGNFAIRNIEGEIVSAFGLNNGDKVDDNKKVFYVEHLTAWNSALSTYKDSIFIFGPAITLKIAVGDDANGEEQVYAVENGKELALGKYNDLMGRIFTTDSSYIDFEEEFRRAAAYSKELSDRNSSQDATVDTADNGDKTIKGVGDEVVITMTGEELATANQRLMSFNASKAGQKFIINVKLTESSYSFTSNGMFYKLNGKDLSNSEDNAFSSGSIIWNFINPDGTPYTGTITIENNWLGTVFAPRATVNFGVVNGSVVADRVHKLQGESHKGDYNSNKISYTVTKKWGEDGKATHDDIEVSLYRRVRLQSGAFADGGVLDRANIGDTTKYEHIRDGVISCSTGATSLTFTDLPSSDEYGYTCDYFVVEKNVPGGYKASYEGNNVIVNEPTTPGPTLARLTFTAQKTLEGADLTAGQFTFVLTGDGIEEAKEAANDAKGNISWGEFAYEKAGTYTYTITEKSGNDENVTYDRTVYTVTVVVVADDAGNLSVESITYTKDDGTSADGVAFTNTYSYSAEGDAVIEAFKTLNSKAPGANVFTFILEDKDHHEITTAVNDGYGNITFKDIDALHYTQDDIGKTFTYYVREKNEGKDGYVYSEAVYEVKITVVDNGDGTLSGAVVYEGGVKPAFDNKYDAKGELQLNAVKVLKNGELTDGAFTFTLTETDANGKVTVHNVTNAADGTLNLPKFEYGLEDLARSPITYELAEVDGKNPNVVYDKAVYKVVVTLTDDGQGNIVVATEGKVDSFTFTNTNLTDVEAKIQAHKTLNGTDPGDKTFWFVLIDESGKETKVQNNGGDIDFGTFKYTAADLGKTYTYTIKEIEQDRAGYVFDKKEYTVTVTITDEDQDGKLEAKVLYNNSETIPTFTNTYTAEGDVTVRATKILNGERTLEAGQFTFELWDITNGKPGTKKGEATNSADGSITFETITYQLSDAGKTFTYEVREVQGAAGSGYTYDSTVYTVKVTVTDEGTGELIVTPVYVEGEAIFNNYYEAEGSTHFEAQKELSGRALENGQFSFELYEKNGEDLKLLQTKGNSGKSIVFDEIEYKKAGVYTYVIKEVIGDEKGYTYDRTSYEVTVTVTDNGDGTLKVETAYEGGDVPTFSNEYKATGRMALGATKTLNGKAPNDGQFSFELRDAAGSVLQTRSNMADGSISFDAIEYTQEDVGKTFTYTIHEVQGAAGVGYTYDQTVYTVTVEVKDKGDGTLEAIPVYSRNGETVGGAAFANTYNADGSIVLTATKALSGRTLADKQFSFILEGEGISQTVYNDGSGNIVFEALNYTLDDVGEHHYTLKEVVETKDGYTYDQTVYEVVVTVVDEGNGQLSVTATYNGSTTAPTFSNEYKATGKMTLGATKTLNGKAPGDAQFNFELRDAAGNVLQTRSNMADGSISFDAIGYTQADIGKTFTYTIHEVQGAAGVGYTYDQTVYTVTVEVKDKGDGTLEAIPVYSRNGETVGGAAFANTYDADGSIVLTATKALSGRTLADKQFSFILEGEGISQTVYNDGSGNIVFEALNYTLDDVGEHHYTLKEVVETKDGYTYDQTVYEVVVTVTDIGGGKLSVTATYNGKEELPAFKNSYKADGSVVLEATKTLTGRTLEARQFTFVLKDAAGNVLQTKTNAADGKIIFDKIGYTQEDAGKTFTYTISESVTDPVTGYEYDSKEYTVTVEVTDNGNGELTAIPVYSLNNQTVGGAAFVNTYSADGSIVLKATKVLEGRTLAVNQFYFELKDADGKVLQTVQNDEGGNIIFKALEYGLDDVDNTYIYTISEVKETRDGYKYDETVYEVKVTITDKGDGTLDIDVQYVKGTPVFTNYYDAKGEMPLEAKKVLIGRELEAGQFSFVLKDAAGNELQTVSNDGDGKISFEAIKYTTADIDKEYTYTINEVFVTKDGYTYDATVYTVTVLVTDNGDGTISAVPVYTDANGGTVTLPTFTNYYNAEGEAIIVAQKSLEGRALQDDQFTFILEDEAGNEIERVTNLGTAVTFTALQYKLEDAGKTFTYYVRELADDQAGYTYVDTRFKVTVEVTDAGNGTLATVIKYDGSDAVPVFKNSYDAEGEFTLTANKTLAGRALEEGQFSFELVDASGNVLQTVTNAEDGSITFESIKYTISDVANSPITYTVREKSGDAEGYTYDTTVYTVIVTLKDNGDGTILVTTEYVGVEGISFTNTYAAEGEAVLRARKTLEGGTLTNGQFSFELRDEEGNVLQTKQNDAGGAVVFDPISYTLEDDGRTFNYTIREVMETAEGYVYDETVHNVTVTVSDSGTGRLEIVITYDSGEATFVNRYVPTPTPTPGTTPGPEETPTPGDEPTPTPGTTTGPTPTPSGDVLGARRTQIGGTDAAVLGARRGSDFAVLGKRRRPSTGDSFAMVMWILAMMTAAGGAIISLVMMRHNKKKGE